MIWVTRNTTARWAGRWLSSCSPLQRALEVEGEEGRLDRLGVGALKVKYGLEFFFFGNENCCEMNMYKLKRLERKKE